MRTEPLLVVGAGSWGTALAIVAARTGWVMLWGRDAAQIAEMAAARVNRRYLPGILLPPEIEPVASLEAALKTASDVLVVVPVQALRETVLMLGKAARHPLRVAWACKGFERGTGRLPHEVVAEVLGAEVPLAALSGPTFAREVAEDRPAAITVATRDRAFGAALVTALHGGRFRPYSGDDLIGVEAGGALKNVIAIAAGMADGLQLGANTRAAIITRGLAETSRLGVALGGKETTFTGLSGLGDLVLTCTDDRSRNRRLGLALARGEALDSALARVGPVVEGVETAHTALMLADRLHVEIPITREVALVLNGAQSVEAAASALLARDPRAESEPASVTAP